MGEVFRRGESRPFTQDDLALHERARSKQALHEVPVLQRSDQLHEYLFFALFDGAGHRGLEIPEFDGPATQR